MRTADKGGRLEFEKGVPTLEDFRKLRSDAGWGLPTDSITRDALKETIFGVLARTADGSTVGMGRIVGDGGLQVFVTDLIVHTLWQNQGIGSHIMKLLMEYIESHMSPATFVGLFSAFGRHGFYEKFGFIARPNETLGPGMVYFPRGMNAG